MRAALYGSLRRLPRPVYVRLRGTIPSPIRRSLVRAMGPAPDAVAAATPNPYAAAWETLARRDSGRRRRDGDFDLIGRIELGVLLMEGLRPTDTLLDFGCGSGRLALKAIPVLREGHYFGVDISQTMVELARDRVATQYPNPSCRVSWLQLGEPPFPFEERSIDVACAFSVFTHIEHEDAYRYLKDALRIVRPGGRFIFSCLPMTLAYARPFFLASAARDFRWPMDEDAGHHHLGGPHGSRGHARRLDPGPVVRWRSVQRPPAGHPTSSRVSASPSACWPRPSGADRRSDEVDLQVARDLSPSPSSVPGCRLTSAPARAPGSTRGPSPAGSPPGRREAATA